jgi:hypothetical protein
MDLKAGNYLVPMSDGKTAGVSPFVFGAYNSILWFRICEFRSRATLLNPFESF